MKKLIIILLLTISHSNCNSQTNSNKLIASCCEDGRGCTGSSYCTACKNCSGCRYCAKNGGTCGVCNGGRGKKYNSYSSSNRKTKTYVNSKISHKLFEGKNLYVAVSSLNLREGPGIKYKIIEKLNKNSKLIYMNKDKSWIKVQVEKSNLIGYVYYKYLY